MHSNLELESFERIRIKTALLYLSFFHSFSSLLHISSAIRNPFNVHPPPPTSSTFTPSTNPFTRSSGHPHTLLATTPWIKTSNLLLLHTLLTFSPTPLHLSPLHLLFTDNPRVQPSFYSIKLQLEDSPLRYILNTHTMSQIEQLLSPIYSKNLAIVRLGWVFLHFYKSLVFHLFCTEFCTK